MGCSFKFEDNSVKIKSQMKNAAIAALYEMAGEIHAQTVRNSAVGKIGGGKTKGSWQYVVDEETMTAYIGSNYENAIWEEFGTGEYALNGDGRKGGWWIPLDAGGMTEAQAQAYGFTIRKGKNGKKYAFTKGKKPKRALFKAFTSVKSHFGNIVKNHYAGISSGGGASGSSGGSGFVSKVKTVISKVKSDYQKGKQFIENPSSIMPDTPSLPKAPTVQSSLTKSKSVYNNIVKK